MPPSPLRPHTDRPVPVEAVAGMATSVAEAEASTELEVIPSRVPIPLWTRASRTPCRGASHSDQDGAVASAGAQLASGSVGVT
jgi:hypothetical protein